MNREPDVGPVAERGHVGGHDEEPAETLDALDFVARVLAHIPDPRRHLVHYYGAYSNVTDRP